MVGRHRISVCIAVFIFVITACVEAHAATPAFVPIHISIPTASMSADVIGVRVTPTGHLDTPHNFVQAGWYMKGTVPGYPGSAVIDGHVDNGASIPGVFKHLKNVKLGDDISITRADGKVLHFLVTKTDVYPYASFPSASVFATSNMPLLKIITCHGKWLPDQDTYNERLVVTAVLRQA